MANLDGHGGHEWPVLPGHGWPICPVQGRLNWSCCAVRALLGLLALDHDLVGLAWRLVLLRGVQDLRVKRVERGELRVGRVERGELRVERVERGELRGEELPANLLVVVPLGLRLLNLLRDPVEARQGGQIVPPPSVADCISLAL